MTRLDGYRSRLVLVGFVVGIVFGGGNAKADFTFGKPTNLGPTVNSSNAQWGPSLSADSLELYFGSNHPISGLDPWNLWVATRKAEHDAWPEPVPLSSEINSAAEDGIPQLSPDGLELYFYSKRSGGLGGIDIWVTRRSTKDDPWGSPVNVGAPVNSSAHEGSATITADGLEIYFSRTSTGGGGGYDIWTANRATRNSSWSSAVKLGPTINSSASENSPSISADGLVLVFSSHASGAFPVGGYGGPDIWMTKRLTKNDSWEPLQNLGSSVNTARAENCPSISFNGRWLLFDDWGGNRPGGNGNDDLWQAPIIPVVDFNRDLKVNIEDLTILIEHWGQNEPVYDMGPMPWGDGIVDESDLKVLMSYWGQPVYDPHLLAHWKMDETEGDVAYDSAAQNDAVVIGDAIWQPEGGQINGALQFDGFADYIQAPQILNPADTVFSVFAWVKGGAPGQVILSQQDGVDWLLTDTQGYLMTALQSSSGRIKSGPLISEMTITDGHWRRVGFVRDGSERILYVDDIEVARDTVNNLDSASGNLYIGTGNILETGSFWSGMIDDVRIYDRVVVP